MYDRGTGSYWSQVTGEAIRGPLAGRRLSEVPSVVTNWGDWKKLHPDTLVLRSDVGPRRSPYQAYFESPGRLGVLGTQNPDERLPGKTWVWGLVDNGEATAIVEGLVGRTARTLRLKDHSIAVSRDGTRLVLSPAGAAELRRMYWYIWASFHPGSRIWPETANE